MATQLGADILAVPGDLSSNTATPMTTIGSKAVSSDGRAFRYVKAGATALVPGKLQQAPAEVTNHQNLVPSAAAIGDTSVTVTLGATAATANQYAGGWLVGTETPGEGQQYKIKSHPAADASATLVLTLEDPLVVALTSSSHLDLVPNPYNGVIVNPTTASSSVVGVAVFAITAAQYGWIQVSGPANTLADGALTVGTSLVASNAVAGAVEAATGAQAVVGIAMTGIADTEYGMVDLSIE